MTTRRIFVFLGANESLTMSPEAIKQIKNHIDSQSKRIKDLEDQLRVIPQMQVTD